MNRLERLPTATEREAAISVARSTTQALQGPRQYGTIESKPDLACVSVDEFQEQNEKLAIGGRRKEQQGSLQGLRVWVRAVVGIE